ncbi:hypothetical protein [Bradyrhizobium oligotrophicum]|uniref:hypothetical protein n=1 Tax=Bradyrhizobium oligotrophicum TaxID=44255 RepID=UPI003EBFD530
MALTRPMRLVKTLYDKSRAGHVDWQVGIGDDEFQVSSAEYTIKISTKAGRQGSTDYVIAVLNDEGTVVDRFTDVELDSEEGSQLGQWYGTMRELHDMARRHARGADKALDAILKELGEDDIPF